MQKIGEKEYAVKLITIMKRWVFLFSALFLFTLHTATSQNLIVKNATTTTMVLTDFVYIDAACGVPMPNFYGVNFTLPPTSYSYPPVFFLSAGWKLGVSDGSNWSSVRDETQIGCGTGFVNSATIGSNNMIFWYEHNGDIFLYIY